MVKARQQFIKMQQKLQDKKQEEKSWRPIIDRRRKTSNQSRASRSGRRSTSFNSSGGTTPNDSCSCSDTSMQTEKSGLTQDLSDMLLSGDGIGKVLDNEENSEAILESREVIASTHCDRIEKNRDLRQPFSELKGNRDNSDAPPIKKMRTAVGHKTTLQDLNLGDGIITRRRLPKVVFYRSLSLKIHRSR